MSAIATPAIIRDHLVADARSMPDLIASAQAMDPAFAEQLTGKALVYSKTVWATPVGAVVGWAVTRYGLGWDPAMCSLLTGVVVWGLVTAATYVRKGPISSILPAKATP